jgi:hypothetical protein
VFVDELMVLMRVHIDLDGEGVAHVRRIQDLPRNGFPVAPDGHLVRVLELALLHKELPLFVLLLRPVHLAEDYLGVAESRQTLL